MRQTLAIVNGGYLAASPLSWILVVTGGNPIIFPHDEHLYTPLPTVLPQHPTLVHAPESRKYVAVQSLTCDLCGLVGRYKARKNTDRVNAWQQLY